MRMDLTMVAAGHREPAAEVPPRQRGPLIEAYLGAGWAGAELGVYGLLFQQTGRDELVHLVWQRIGPVLDYDVRRRGDLERTLRT